MNEPGCDGPVDESAGGGWGDVGERCDVGDRYRLLAGRAAGTRLDNEQGGHFDVAAVGLDDPLAGGAPQPAQPQERLVQPDNCIDSHEHAPYSQPLALWVCLP